MQVAVTYTIVVDTEKSQPRSADGRPPRNLAQWDPEVLNEIDAAALEYFRNATSIEPVAVEILED